MHLPPTAAACAVVLLCGVALADDRSDLDRDGVPDSLEQALLERFLPKFLVSIADCDTAPSEFEANVPYPRAKDRNGTIYGQVMPVHDVNRLELHYFHLWGRDCGAAGHPLDVESVSALLVRDNDRWKAEYWYASAHENTLCDMGNVAPAAAVSAVDAGPSVWISQDKHASYLDPALCSKGCGKDVCQLTSLLQVPRVINLGEAGRPLNGSVWISSPQWNLARKMEPRFTASLVARLPQANAVALLPVRDVAPGTRSAIKVAGGTYSSISNANEKTADGLGTARSSVRSSLGAAYSSTRRAIGRAMRSVRGK